MRQAQSLDEHRGLQTHTEESFWKANSLIAYALTWRRSSARAMARCLAEAPSPRRRTTTRTSLRLLESTVCERSSTWVSHTLAAATGPRRERV